ncbi:MAG: DUF3473 domain-containing protein [Caldiserica bacterium]|nr:DUF3473 domain-containing protein [Caldisericota bacterium]
MKVVPNGILTVDVEDISCANFPLQAEYTPEEKNIEKGVKEILALLASTQSRATFFILGEIAKKKPALVKEIVKSKNKVASHGMTHRLVYQIGSKEFRREIQDSRKLLEDISGERVIGYRAPSWSIDENSLWALDILQEEGFLYDSSIFPVKNFLYGIDNFPPYPHQIGKLWEIPPSTLPFPRKRLPIGGGAYFRFFPAFLISQGLKWLSRRKIPLVLYFHTWEILPPEKLPAYSLFHQLIVTHNLSCLKNKVDRILEMGKFFSIEEYLDA